jgi:transcriptional regulator with XRE-family HTH domain
MPPKPPDPIDAHVGKRIQMRRVEQKMSRATLGDFIGLTFQQVEKYERGVNRIGASRIQQICTALKIPVSFVFEGAPGSSPSVNGVPQYIVEFMTSACGLSKRSAGSLTRKCGAISCAWRRTSPTAHPARPPS